MGQLANVQHIVVLMLENRSFELNEKGEAA